MPDIHFTEIPNVFYWSFEKQEFDNFLKKSQMTLDDIKILSKMDGYFLFTYCFDQGFLLYYPNNVKTSKYEKECVIDWKPVILNCEGSWPVGILSSEINSEINEDDYISIPIIKMKSFIY